jgi:hypothetical protein
MARNKIKKITVILAGLLVLLLMSGGLVKADDETDVGAGVEVLPGGGISYGARVTGVWNVLLAGWALGEPDGRSAFVFRNGWVSIELEGNVASADTVSIWAANSGWWPSLLKIYVSANGKQWKQVGNQKVTSSAFRRYDFTGSFGSVKYIKVCRNGWPWSWLCLDAVGAKGGDTGNQGKDNKKQR